jgi:hypothetical protein
MTKPPKIPRPQKPSVRPYPGNIEADPTIRMQTERLIGRSVVAWSKLEACLEDFIWELLALPIEKGRHITTRLDAVNKIKMLRSIGEIELVEADFHRLSPILDHIDIIRDDRNFIIHGTWGRAGFDKYTVVLSLRAKGGEPDEVVSETFPDSRIRTVISDIEKWKQELIELMNSRQPLPRTPVLDAVG